ncbi:MAG: glycosyltransferase [Solirubrobacteraceae bacterium]
MAFATEGAEALGSLGIVSTLFSTAMGQIPSAGSCRPIRPDELPENAARLDLHLFPVQSPHRLAFSPSMARGLARVTNQYDLVHIHSLWLFPQFAAQWAARRARVPYVVSPHGALDPYLRRHGRVRKALSDVTWQRRMLRDAALMHITTEEEGELIATIAPATPRYIAPVGVWTDRLRSTGDAARFRARFLGGSDAEVVLFLGRITYKKGLDLLIRSFAHVARESDGPMLVIAGPDDEDLRPRLEQLVRDEGLVGRVVFTGPVYQDDRADAFAAASVWALSSYTENFGVAVMEALAVGLPTIVSTEVNLAGVIREHRAGVVAGTTPEEFGAALVNLLADKEGRAELGHRARALAGRYDWSVVAPQLVAMYGHALVLADPGEPRQHAAPG